MLLRGLAMLASGLSLLVVSAVGVLAEPALVKFEPPVGLEQRCLRTLTASLHAQPTRGPSARVLACDRRDRGRAVISFGDPATADDLVVLVPGSDTDLSTLVPPAGGAAQPRTRPHGGPLDWARTLAAHAAPRTAVVLWVGYATPQGLGRAAATGAAARAAAPALAEEVRSLQQLAPRAPRTTVIGHSYGAVVAALAADALEVDSFVLVASPGAHARTVHELGTTASVWAMQSAHDWIRRVPGWRIGDLGHGTKPSDPAFGAHLVPADDVIAHDDYFTPGRSTFSALESIIATGFAAMPKASSPSDSRDVTVGAAR